MFSVTLACSRVGRRPTVTGTSIVPPLPTHGQADAVRRASPRRRRGSARASVSDLLAVDRHDLVARPACRRARGRSAAIERWRSARRRRCPRPRRPASRARWCRWRAAGATIRADRLARDGEADADRGAGRRDDDRADADHLAVHVEHRPAGVARIDRRVELQEIVERAGAEVAPRGRDDAGGDRTAQAERIAGGQDPVADLHLAASCPRCTAGQRLVGDDLDHRDVGQLVLADARGRVAAPLVSETTILSAWPTTWLLVTMMPDGSMMKPEPAPPSVRDGCRSGGGIRGRAGCRAIPAAVRAAGRGR